jgi:predicted acetylornithine/succinylornithine family transaminase
MFVRGEGARLWDADGRRYLDFFSGLAVTGLGHAHPAITRAVAEQAATLVHVSNLFHTQPQRDVAEALVTRTFPSKVFFSNSGAEANECALKLARRHGHLTGGRHEIIVFDHAFHGRTFGSLSATPQKKYQDGFGPMLPGFPVAPFGDIAAVERLIGPKTCAILVEPVQGEGGVHMADPAFFQALSALCRKHNLLLMFDEIQTGIGRTGALFAFQKLGVTPDVLSIAKGLANGYPIGATLAKPEVADLLKPGDHASTFGGGPVVCRAAQEVLKALSTEQLRRVETLGQRVRDEISSWRSVCPAIKDVRGMGLMIGVELDRSGVPIVEACREAGLLVNCTAETVVRLLPPFVLTDAEAAEGLSILKDALKKVCG